MIPEHFFALVAEAWTGNMSEKDVCTFTNHFVLRSRNCTFVDIDVEVGTLWNLASCLRWPISLDRDMHFSPFSQTVPATSDH